MDEKEISIHTDIDTLRAEAVALAMQLPQEDCAELLELIRSQTKTG